MSTNYANPGTEDYELMEVDEDEMMKPQVPQLSSFNLMPSSSTGEALPPSLPSNRKQQPSQPAAICFFKQEPVDLQQKQQQQQQLAAQQPRRQQTNEPVRLDEVFSAHHDDSSGACPPGIEWLDGLQASGPVSTNLPALSGDEVAKELECLDDTGPIPGSSTSYCDPTVPCVPEVLDQPTSPMEPGQPTSPQMFVIIPHSTEQRKRRPTISLMPDHQLDSPSSHGCLFGDDARDDIMQELMDEADADMGADHWDHIPIPSTCKATSAEHRQYDDSARRILQMHQELAQDMPHAKKKPMLHEFLGYILFSRDPELSILHGSIYFCRDTTGDRLEPQRLHGFFRVAKFPAVSEVWKRIKCNSSKDCTKNMKRAMRMSTSNERRYFVNLPQRMHRMQIFQFGERSLEYFQRIFPHGVEGQRR